MSEDYLRLKQEAFEKRKSFSAIVRKKVDADENKMSKAKIERFFAKCNGIAKKIRRKT